MNGLATQVVRIGAGFGALLTLGWVIAGHAAPPVQHGFPTDWTHRHVVFSQPSTPAQVQRVFRDSRFWQQQDRRNFAHHLTAGQEVSDLRIFRHPLRQPKIHRDWSVDLGAGASVGAGNFPAKYTFRTTTATCGDGANPDFVVFSTGLPGAASQASIVGFDNLYSGCATGAVPSVYWAYNTGGAIETSPVFSQDGKHVAFVETSGGAGILVLLKWAAGTGTVGAPAVPTNVLPASYAACVAPCMTQIGLKDGATNPTDDTTSSVFYDYGGDVAWVGGASGWLHKIAPVFNGVPTEVTTGGFPVQVNPGSPTALSSPVYDSGSGNVFVGDLGGFFYQVGPTATVVKSGQLDAGAGLVSGPLLDSTAEQMFIFASNNTRHNCAAGTLPCASVYQFPINFPAGTIETDVAVGASTDTPTPAPLYLGAFDNAYLTSGNATGSIYVCGNTGQRPIMYRVSVAGNTIGPVTTGPALATGSAECSPVTDVFNSSDAGGDTEWIFAGTTTLGFGNSCAAGGCVISFKNQAWTPNTAYVVGQEVLDDTFQIQVVRVSGTSGATDPSWSTTAGATTVDGGVSWLDQGPQTPSHGFWFPNQVFAAGVALVDSNQNIQLATTTGTSQGGVHPTWSTTVNGITNDGSITWKNVGSIATFSLTAAGGSSGIIIDNVVGTATQAGGSQIYFTTQHDQACGTSGTGGCAVQASQAALQ